MHGFSFWSGFFSEVFFPLDTWAEEELKTGTLSNGTVGNYLQAVGRIKQHPISKRKLKTVTSVHLQEFMDLLSFGGTVGDFVSKGYSIDYVRSFSAVLQQSLIKAMDYVISEFKFVCFTNNLIIILHSTLAKRLRCCFFTTKGGECRDNERESRVCSGKRRKNVCYEEGMGRSSSR